MMLQAELFSTIPFSHFSDERRRSCANAIRSINVTEVLTANEDSLAELIEAQYLLEAPVLKPEDMYMDGEPEEVSGYGYQPAPFGGQVGVTNRYLKFTLCIPFEGSPDMFRIQPSNRRNVMGRDVSIELAPDEVRFTFNELLSGGTFDPERIYSPYIDALNINARNLAQEISIFNDSLRPMIREHISKRKQEAGQNKAAMASFKIPVKRRSNLSPTYSIPEIRRKPSIIEQVESKAVVLEPTLEIAEYENILTIMKNVAVAMERSPATFSRMSETEIRDMLVVHLNGHYEGNVTGETFNGIGKTDILLRYKNANAFIGECKIWKGSRGLTEAIDQLLGYVTWRDTKAAILIFNRGTDLTAILQKTNEAVRAHPHFKEATKFKSTTLTQAGTVLSYKMMHPSDVDKEVFMSVLAFQITSP